ncbi:MAG: lytic murein transglycosylase B [Hydrogenophaga sp.]|uniref:lytic murein transglycosylase B n=1 Tax=Hydrogenophaga sp. TaxID=1904254 RepID=UPI001D6EAC5E|nr:lytic murein transglycosylase B [Hydrogenophaga sp.]MBX3609953.1 lytic murein transglycosylase B [Hydrogenophaga sp.]
MNRRDLFAALLSAPALSAAPVWSQTDIPAKRRAGAPVADAGPLYRDVPAAMAFADDLAQRRGLDATWVREQIGRARKLDAAIRGVTPPPTGVPKNWAAYRARFIEPIRLAAGQRFWQDNRDTLARAEAQFGVPASLVVGVIGVETLYGRHTGTHKVMDAITTLAFDFPSVHPRAATRSAFFRDELEQLLALCQRSDIDPHSLLGSFAGAMGWPQFMPSSWANYAIDFDGDGKVDLFNSQADVIGSVANYFKTFGWQTGMPTHYPVRFDDNKLDLETLLAPDILPSFSVEAFTAKGAVLDGPALQHPGKLALVELQNADAPPSYVAGTDNFYVVTRYNWSSYYAMAVIELGEAVKAGAGR